MTDAEIIEEVRKYKARQIVLTGGEPSLFIDSEFLKSLKEASGLEIAIETNGTNPLPEGIDWVTVSPKEGIDDVAGDARIKVLYANEIKVVDVGQNLEPYFSLPCKGEQTEMLLQPCFVEDEAQCTANMRNTIRRVLEDPRWRLSLQTHRFAGIR